MQEDFEVGDEVYVVYYDYRAPLEKTNVSRVTKTRAMVRYGRTEKAFNRQTGREVGGGGYSTSRLERPSPRLERMALERIVKNARRYVADVALRAESAASLRAAYAAWDKAVRDLGESE